MMGTKAIPIYIPAKRPRIGTIGKNHIQSSSNLSRTALFVVCSESDTFLKNYIIISNILNHLSYTADSCSYSLIRLICPKEKAAAFIESLNKSSSPPERIFTKNQ